MKMEEDACRRGGRYHLYDRVGARPGARKSGSFLNRNAERRDFIDVLELKTRRQGSERLLRGDVLSPFFQVDYFASRLNEHVVIEREKSARHFFAIHIRGKRYLIRWYFNEIPGAQLRYFLKMV